MRRLSVCYQCGRADRSGAPVRRLFTGYHRQDEASISADRKDSLGKRYVRTGDIGRLDGDGFLWLCGRTKEMIISGGYNVYPADIERVALDHPSLLEVAVVGFESARWGETPVAFLSLREGAEEAEGDIRTWINSRVGTVQRVAAVRLLTELPSGVMGKILERELRSRFSGVFGVFTSGLVPLHSGFDRLAPKRARSGKLG